MIPKAQLKAGVTLRFGPTIQINTSSVTVWNGRMTSSAVLGPSADSSRLEVQLDWRLCRQSRCVDSRQWHCVYMYVEFHGRHQDFWVRAARGQLGGGIGEKKIVVIGLSTEEN